MTRLRLVIPAAALVVAAAGCADTGSSEPVATTEV